MHVRHAADAWVGGVGDSRGDSLVKADTLTVFIKPTKANIAIKLVALAWTPHWRDEKGTLTAAWI
ncbi:MAG: hypothetical protein AABY61_14180 [Nitrospirota bacterium]